MRSSSRARAVDRLVRADRRLAAALSVREIDELSAASELAAAQAVDGSPAQSSLLTGATPTTAALARARRANVTRAFAARRELFASTLTTAEVSALVGVSAGALRARVRAGAVLAIRDERRRLRFPAWQFDADDPSAVIAGLARVLVILRSQRLSEVRLARWFLTPKSLLAGRTPLEALRDGDVDDVLSDASALRAS